MPRRDGGSWNAIISASSRAGHPAEAFSLFADMNSLGIRPKDVTLASVLACCVLLSALTCVVHSGYMVISQRGASSPM
ncbi:Pentatricopeptide repeat-containing protein [Zea mays]|uniref:Pentatricopeptide repeat-containing protein n=1 Tax=Zea mays TaxID=4577 RepID=A0A3L6G6K4_MAIZE|nr:Pentatricopeptide repeat-containing protein [Zea mays]